jgi:hypothetical protein
VTLESLFKDFSTQNTVDFLQEPTKPKSDKYQRHQSLRLNRISFNGITQAPQSGRQLEYKETGAPQTILLQNSPNSSQAHTHTHTHRHTHRHTHTLTQNALTHSHKTHSHKTHSHTLTHKRHTHSSACQVIYAATCRGVSGALTMGQMSYLWASTYISIITETIQYVNDYMTYFLLTN